MSFSKPDCRAFCERAQTIILLIVGAITLTALGVLFHSIWVLRP
jgi:hypothetical protein